MSNTDELLSRINSLKQHASQYTADLQDAKTRDALIAAQMNTLTEKLQEAAGTIDWSELDNLIEKAAKKAQKAVEALAEALDEAGVDHE